MSSILQQIDCPEDLKKLNLNEKIELASEIRELLLNIVSKNGGHLASNLGVVELTIALHSVFDTPKDKLIWDVGHQSYVHKIITERKDKMNTLRKFEGISGFPKVNESEYDAFDTGHSSTSISVATGMARARDLLNENHRVIAIIGDGSLTGGMALEALNDAGSSKTDLIVILNDNEMSISKNIGGIPNFLSKLRTRRFYTNSNKRIREFTKKIPVIGDKIVNQTRRLKKVIKQYFIPNMYFEDIGFTYLGPVDGHNIEKLEDILERSKTISGPILIHTITKKGKGYKIAEENPDKFHGVSSFDVNNGEPITPKQTDYSAVFGKKIVELAKENNKIVTVTAAMKDGTGLKEFANTFPDRFFDVGIAEQHAVGLIAGMAKAGLKPVLAIYSSFLQRAYDQLVHDIAIQKLPVVICVDRAGIVGNDGETHQGIFDVPFTLSIPNINIMAPKNFEELEKMLEFAMNLDKPIIIRYPRGGEGKFKFDKVEEIEFGKSELIQEGNDLTIIASGRMVERAVEVANILKEQDIDVEVINLRFLKPLDEKTIKASAEKTKRIVVIEDNLIKGGIGSEILNIVKDLNIDIQIFGYDDTFVEHGSINELENKYGLDAQRVAKKITEREKDLCNI